MKDIKGYEGRYAITSCGKVWSYFDQRFMLPADNGCGYLKINLLKNGKKKMCSVSRLVAEAYIPNPNNLSDVDHIDENKHNNNVNNLRWLSRSDNVKHSSQKGKPKQHTPILCVETGEIYPTQAAAAIAVGINRQGIVNVLAGKQHTAGGFHWERVLEDMKNYDDALAADLLLLELEEKTFYPEES